jgi:hypothetical protein
MTEPYIIAHIVRSKPAFDIATCFSCPECNPACAPSGLGCDECNHEGYWWIIPTSGHRAYPYWIRRLDAVMDPYMPDIFQRVYESDPGPIPTPPPNHRDHYQVNAAPGTGLLSNLATRLGLIHPLRVNRR